MIVFAGPGLLPDRTLSSSDTLWFDPPWVYDKPADLTVPSNTDLGDATQYLEPYLRRSAEAMPGDVPLWNPYITGGRPFHASAQSALFGPFTWPAYLLPFLTALGWIAALKLWVAAFGAYLLGRALGMRFAGALLAGLVFALNLKLVTWLIYPAMGVWAWYPWLLVCAERLVRRPDALTGGALAAVVALQFLTGHPESSFHALLLTTLFFAFRLWQARRSSGQATRVTGTVLAYAAALMGGALVAAATLIPLTELLLQSADLVDRRGQSIDRALPLKDAVGLFMPDWWGRPTQTPIRPIMLERAMYVGALPLMLGVAALVLRRDLTRWVVAGFGALTFAVVLGIPPFVQVVTRLPVFSSGHNTRLIVFAMLCLALLAGWGLDELTGRLRAAQSSRPVVLVAACILLALPVLIVAVASPDAFTFPRGGLEVAWLFADPPGRVGQPLGLQLIRASSLVIWLTFAAAGVLLLWLRLGGRLGAASFAALALALVCADLFRAGMGQNPAIERRFAERPSTPAIRLLERDRPARFVSTGEFPDNVIPFTYGLFEARGYDIPIVKRYDRLWRREITPGAPSVAADFIDIPLRLREVTPRTLRTLRLLGVRYLLGPRTLEPGPPAFDRLVDAPPLEVPGLRLIQDGPDARVYRIDGALPRTWLAGAQTVVADDSAALEAITQPSFSARRTVVTEDRVAGLPHGKAEPPGDSRISRYGEERVTVRTRASREAMLVLSDNWYPGWKAELDGREVPIERVDYLFRGVRVGPGSHTVEFRYEPLSWRVGWIVSLISAAGLAVVLLVGVRRRR